MSSIKRETQKPDQSKNSNRNEELIKILYVLQNVDGSSRAFKFILIFRSHFLRTCDCDYSHSHWLAVSPCFAENQDKYQLFERVAIGYSKYKYVVRRAPLKQPFSALFENVIQNNTQVQCYKRTISKSIGDR